MHTNTNIYTYIHTYIHTGTLSHEFTFSIIQKEFMLHRVHVIKNIIPAFRRKWPERRPDPISLTLLAVQKGALTKLPGRCSPLRSATGRIWPTSTPENESDTALSVCTHIYYILQPLHVTHQIHKLLLKHTFIHTYIQKAQGVGTHITKLKSIHTYWGFQ